jgi:hypothetical protein
MPWRALVWKIGMVFSAMLLGSIPAAAQAGSGSLTVSAVVQTSVALVSIDGEWRIVVANPGVGTDNVSSLTPVSMAAPLAQSQIGSRRPKSGKSGGGSLCFQSCRASNNLSQLR